MRGTRALSGAKVYLVRTRHRALATYFGTYRAGRSGIFAFASRGLAVRVAQGLEVHRRTNGAFPPLGSAGQLQLGHDGELHELDMLDIEEVDHIGTLVKGSGVMVWLLHEEDDGVHARLWSDGKIQREWIREMFLA